MRNTFLKLVAAVIALGLGACGTGGIGDSCSDIGKTSGCDDGLICDVNVGKNVCIKICTADSECASTEACTVVTGLTTKGCHSK